MKPLPLRQFAEIVGGRLSGCAPSAAPDITGFATDSRDVRPGDAFIAIVGANVDGHDFAGKAFASGALAVLAEREVPGCCIVVDSIVGALARLGNHYRRQFAGPVIGITGSAGKTTTKEFLAAALRPLGTVLKTEGNRNTEYTSPLLWPEFDGTQRSAVVEMGMRGFGQIAHLAGISEPDVGIITNIGWSHIELVGSREGIARAKGELLEALPSGGVAVLWHEDEYLGSLRTKARCAVSTFGFEEGATCRITAYHAAGWTSSHISGTMHGERWEAHLPTVGRHIALNAAAALTAAAACGVDLRDAAEAMGDATLPPNRMEILEYNGATIVLDAYNASPPSMIAALETLAATPSKGRRLAVLGQMNELGEMSEQGHREVGEVAASLGLDVVAIYGEKAQAMHSVAPERFAYARSLDEVKRLLLDLQPGDTVLMKGSRSLELEKAVPR